MKLRNWMTALLMTLVGFSGCHKMLENRQRRSASRSVRYRGRLD